MAKDIEKYKNKKAKDFNIFTYLYQLYARFIVFPLFTFLFYNIKYLGRKNVDLKQNYIVAPNHISYLDVFMVAIVLRKPVAYMAKKELFESSEYVARNISRLGAFPVNREKLEKCTLKTAREVLKTKFDLCIFPQGGIRKNKKLEEINTGLVFFAKMAKRDILPIGISGVETYNWNIFKRPVVKIEVGTPISYEKDEAEIIKEWKEQIANLTGYEIVQSNSNEI
ncbi:MAG: 1-acyl-sn-glycerol-3-phosphate acyltransferase [Cyanobacteria bacterium SIG30]|nr:1-acyl-sn-glycerol-3-phosphate acyltransferase [Cyanobacteria bacterium SIG30]